MTIRENDLFFCATLETTVRVLSVDSDPNALVWVVRCANCDIDAVVTVNSLTPVKGN